MIQKLEKEIEELSFFTTMVEELKQVCAFYLHIIVETSVQENGLLWNRLYS